jgi:O-antigen/teichoic acid export membrane protein
MKKLRSLLTRTLHLWRTDSLFRNALYLIASTAIMSGFGFVFWILVARLYTPEQIGEASALIAATGLIATFSLLGLNSTLVRFLPGSKHQGRDINAAMLLAGALTAVATGVYLLAGHWMGIDTFLLGGPMHKLGFVLLMVAVSLNMLTDSVFIANRRGEYHTVGYAVFSVVKLFTPLFLVRYGAQGVFASFAFATVASLAISLYLMRRTGHYAIRHKPKWDLLKEARAYSANSYIGGLLSGLPAQVMPIIILRSLGRAEVAFFAISWTMANLLYIIPLAATRSLLAESSHNPDAKRAHIRKTAKLLTMVLVPLVAIAIVAAPYLLRIFGSEYAAQATASFRILAFATFFVAAGTMFNTVLNIDKKTKTTVYAQVCNVLCVAVSARWLASRGSAYASLCLLFGYAAVVVFHLLAGTHRRTTRSVISAQA